MTCRIALDTSVIVAGVLPNHPRHDPCAEWLRSGERGEVELSISAHGIAETFATLTARAPNLSVPPAQALALVEHLLGFVEMIEVSPANYVEMIRRSAGAGLHSGVIYDAIHYAAAIQVEARHLLTLNLRDFYRICATPGFVCSPEEASHPITR